MKLKDVCNLSIFSKKCHWTAISLIVFVVKQIMSPTLCDSLAYSIVINKVIPMIDLTAASPLVGRLLAIITLAPRRANSSAVSCPMPPLPPAQ